MDKRRPRIQQGDRPTQTVDIPNNRCLGKNTACPNDNDLNCLMYSRYGRGATQQQQPQPQTQTQPQPRYGAGGVTGNYGN